MRVEEDAYFAGELRAKTLVPSAGCVGDAEIEAAAGIATSKMDHRYSLPYWQSGTVAAATAPIHVVAGATGTVQFLKAGTIVACTNTANVTVDLKKNGASILTDVVTLSNASAARTLYSGTLSNSAVVVGDWLELVVTASAGNGAVGTGLIVEMEIDEEAA